MSDQFLGWGSQPVPYSQEAEEACLGSILLAPEVFWVLKGFLQADDFFLVRHRYIWAAMVKLEQQGDVIDTLTLAEQLRHDGHLDEIGGAAYITQLLNSTPTGAHAETYARVIQRAAIRRRMIAGSDQIKAIAMDETLSTEQVIIQANRIHNETTGVDLGKPEASLFELVGDIMRQVDDRIANPGQLLGIPTGIKPLDKLTLGLQNTDLNIWAAVTGMGKTSLMLSAALTQARLGVRVGFVTQEMPAEQVTRRLIAMESNLNLQKIRAGTLKPDEYRRFTKASGTIGELPIEVYDKTVSPERLLSKALKWRADGGLDILYVDYLQIMSSDGMFKPSQREQEVGYFAASLKDIARELNVPVISGAQLNRDVGERKNKKPVLDDLRESGRIEQSADIVMFLYRGDYYDLAKSVPGMTELIIAKHRNGPTGTVDAYFEKNTTHFRSLMEPDTEVSAG